MSPLNWAYQNVAHSSEFCSTDTEHKLKISTGKADICKLCEKNKAVHKEWSVSIQPMIECGMTKPNKSVLKG